MQNFSRNGDDELLDDEIRHLFTDHQEEEEGLLFSRHDFEQLEELVIAFDSSLLFDDSQQVPLDPSTSDNTCRCQLPS